MPVKVGDSLEQLNRQQNVTGSFFYMMDSANIDFRVDGIVGLDSNRYASGESPSTSESPTTTKYVITDTTTATNWGLSLPTGIGVGDIIHRVNGTWQIFIDVSNTRTNEGTIVYNKYDNKIYYYTGTAWVEVGSGANQTVIGSATLTGVASFDPRFFGIGSSGHLVLTGPYQVTGDTIQAGSAISIGTGKVINNIGVTAFNGLTGAVSLTGDGGAVYGVGNNSIGARFASSTLTGVASYDPRFFAIGASGHLTLTGQYGLTGGMVIRSGGITFSGTSNNTISFPAGSDSYVITEVGSGNGMRVGMANGTNIFFATDEHSIGFNVLDTQVYYVNLNQMSVGVTGYFPNIYAQNIYAKNIVNSLNGLTGAVTLTGAGAVFGYDNNRIGIRNASDTLTGVASFDPRFFGIGASGHVVLASAYQATGDTTRIAGYSATGVAAFNSTFFDVGSTGLVSLTGVYVNANGLSGSVQSVSYHEGDVSSNIVLTLPVRTNLIGHSQGHTGDWRAYGSSSVTDIGEDRTNGWPNGSTGGMELVFAANSNNGIYHTWPSGTLKNNTVYTVSCWVRSVSGTARTRFSYYDNATFRSYFSDDFTIGTTPQRVSYTFRTRSTDVESNVAFGNGSGNGTGTVRVWGFQLEEGSVATSPIKNDTGAPKSEQSKVVPFSAFFGLTGTTGTQFPTGLSGAGFTGDRLIIATGPSADPFRNYVRFGNAWVQTGVVGVGQGPQGEAGVKGATGNTGSGLTALAVNNDGWLQGKYQLDGSQSALFDIGYVRGNTGNTGAGATGNTGSTGTSLTGLSVTTSGLLQGRWQFANGTQSDIFEIGYVRGNTGNTGATGVTGSSLTSISVSDSGILRAKYLFNGTLSDEFDVGYVRGNTGNTGATGATGATGKAGLTGTGLNSISVSLTGSVTYTTVRYTDSDTFIEEGYAGNAKGPTGEVGKTGSAAGLQYRWPGTATTFPSATNGRISVVPGGTGVWISNSDLYNQSMTGFISTWDDTIGKVKGNIIIRGVDTARGGTGTIVFQVTTGHDRTTYWEFEGNLLVGTGGNDTIAQSTDVSVNFLPRGDTGLIDIGSDVGGNYTARSHRSNNTLGTDLGTARKVAFLLENGSLTFDYIRNYDVFKPTDFAFSVGSFAITNVPTWGSSSIVRISNSNTSLVGANISADLVSGPALTAFVYVEGSNEGVGFPISFQGLTNADTISQTIPSGVSITAGPAGSVTLRLVATGSGAVGDKTYTKTYYFYNDILVGVTAQTSIGASDFGPWLTRILDNSVNQTRTVTVGSGEYLYFMSPKRLGEVVFQIGNFAEGYLGAQGLGGVPGISEHAYTNALNYVEQYTVYRSFQSNLGTDITFESGRKGYPEDLND